MYSDEDFKTFAEVTPHMLWTASKEGIIDYCNRYGLSYLNAQKNTVTGKGWVSFVHPDDSQRIRKEWEKAVKKGKPYHATFRLRNGNTQAYEWFKTDANPIFNKRGDVLKWTGININIHPEKVSLEQAELNTSKFESILDCLPNTNVYVFDENFRYLELKGSQFRQSPPIESIIGKTVEEAFGKDWAAFSIPLYKKVLNGETFQEEIETEGTHFLVQGVPITLADEKPKGLLMVRDITKYHSTLTSLEESEQNLRVLLEGAIALPSLISRDEIFEFIAKKIHEFTKELYSVTVSSVVEEETTWIVKSHYSNNKLIKHAEKILSRKIIGLKGKVISEQQDKLRKGELYLADMKLSKLAGGAFGKTISLTLEKLIGFSNIYTMGITYDGKILGIVSILTSKKLPHKEIQIIETLVKQSSLSLDKILHKEKLIEEERKYSSIFSNMAEGLMLLDAAGKITLVNEAGELIFGIPRTQMHGVSFFDLNLHFAVDESTLRSPKTNPIQQVIQKRKSQRAIILGIHKGEERFTWISMNAEPIFKENSEEIESIVVSFAEISKLKRSEDRLSLYLRQQTILTKIAQKLNNAYKLEGILDEILTLIGEYANVSRAYIFENAPNGETTTNTYEWCAEGINAQKDNMIDLPYSAFGNVKESLLADKIICANKVGDLPQPLQELIEPQDVKALVIVPLFIAESFFGFVGFDQCGTTRAWKKSEIDLLKLIAEMLANAFERRKLQLGLEQSEARLMQANQLAKLGHWEWTPATGDIAWSKEIFEFFGFDCQKDKPLPFAEQENLYTAESMKVLRQAVKHSETTGKSYEVEMEANSKKFGTQFFHVVGVPKMENGKMIRLFGSMQDITERKRTAIQIEEQNQSLRALNTELDLIMKVLSHDLKSPINQAKGLMTILALDPTSEEVTERMTRSIQKLEDITEELLNLALDSRSKVEVKELVWGEFIQSCLEEQEAQEGYEAIDWDIKVEPQLFFTDRKRLRIILRNLLSNAIKYRSGEEGVIPRIKVHVLNKENNAMLIVSDNGLGIAEDELELIFQLFYQINQAKSGVGLGLHIVKKMLEKIGGSMEVKSEENKGTEFRVTLPSLEPVVALS